jgi:hypothetical protein
MKMLPGFRRPIMLDDRAELEALAWRRYRLEVTAYWLKWHLAVGLMVSLFLVFAVVLLIAAWNYTIIVVGPRLADWGDFSFLLDIDLAGRRLDAGYFQRMVEYPLPKIELERLPWFQVLACVLFATLAITTMISVLHYEPVVSRQPGRYLRPARVRLLPYVEVMIERQRGRDERCVIDIVLTAPGPASAEIIRAKSAQIAGRIQAELQYMVDNAVWQIRIPALRRKMLEWAVLFVARDQIQSLEIRSIRIMPLIGIDQATEDGAEGSPVSSGPPATPS